MSRSSSAVFRPLDERDYQIYRIFRDDVFPLRQKWQDFQDGRYFPSEAAATLLTNAALVFENLEPDNETLLYNTEKILRAFIATDEETNAAFERALVAFAALIRPKDSRADAAIVIEDSENEEDQDD